MRFKEVDSNTARKFAVAPPITLRETVTTLIDMCVRAQPVAPMELPDDTNVEEEVTDRILVEDAMDRIFGPESLLSDEEKQVLWLNYGFEKAGMPLVEIAKETGTDADKLGVMRRDAVAKLRIEFNVDQPQSGRVE